MPDLLAPSPASFGAELRHGQAECQILKGGLVQVDMQSSPALNPLGSCKCHDFFAGAWWGPWYFSDIPDV